MKAITTTALAFLALGMFAAEIPKAPVPPSPYLPIIYKYADAMLERGRDTNGLFHSALDRTAMAPVLNRVPEGLRLRRSNPHHDQNLLRLLYTLTDLSTKPKYRDAADAELRWFVENADSRNYLSDRPWMLWDRCFNLGLEPKKWFEGPRSPHDLTMGFPRYAGFHIRTWATAYACKTNELFLNAIDRVVRDLENHRDSTSGLIWLGPDISHPWILSGLSLAIDCDAAARLVPEPVASKLRGLASEQDRMFYSAPHDLKVTGGFIAGDNLATAAGRNTALWTPQTGRYRGHTTAQVGMMCVSRYENTGNVAYRDFVHAAADAYLKSMPGPNDDVWPMTFGHAISLQVAAWRSTAQQIYLERARELADFAVKHFFDQGPLPRASLKSNHYEAITGADTLALGLVELHLHILAITAVRYPPNTIDR
jgi:hypothetical protein